MNARAAPHRPKIEQHPFAAKIGQLHPLGHAASIGDRQLRRLFAVELRIVARDAVLVLRQRDVEHTQVERGFTTWNLDANTTHGQINQRFDCIVDQPGRRGIVALPILWRMYGAILQRPQLLLGDGRRGGLEGRRG